MSEDQTEIPGLSIIICLWHFAGDLEQDTASIVVVVGDTVLITLPDVMQHVRATIQNADPSTVIVKHLEPIDLVESLSIPTRED